MLVAVDVDEVCADLLGEWLRRYNLKYKDTLAKEDITEWDMAKQTKCGKAIYDFLRDEDLYANVLPIKGAQEAVEKMREQGHRVVFVSSCVVGQTDQKMEWLMRWGFLPTMRVPNDFIAAHDKSIINADILIDDRPENVEAFPRLSYLVNCPHNEQIECSKPRVAGLHAIPNVLLALNWKVGIAQ